MSGEENTFDLPPMFLYGMAAGLVGTYAIYYASIAILVPKLAPQSFRKKVGQLETPKQKKNLYSTFPSFVHALVQCCSYPMFISLGLSPEHNVNRVTYFDYGWPVFLQGIFVGYLMADFIILTPKDLGLAYCVHHLSAIGTFTWMCGVGSMQWYASMLVIGEFSTIFLNMRQWVLTTGYTSESTVVVRISLAFFMSFFIVRVVPLPRFVYLWVTNDFEQLGNEKGWPVAVASTVMLGLNLALQSFWFFLMMKKLAKKFSSPKKED